MSYYPLSSGINAWSRPIFFPDKYIFAMSKHMCITVFDLCVQVLAMGVLQGRPVRMAQVLPCPTCFQLAPLQDVLPADRRGWDSTFRNVIFKITVIS